MNSKLVKALSALTLFVLMASVVASSAPAYASINGRGTSFGSGPQFGGILGGTSSTSGGTYESFNNGLSINGVTFDISKQTTTIKTQTLYVNTPSDITVKIYNHEGAPLVQHGILFLNLKGADPQPYQTNTYIEWDKNSGVSKSDPNGLLKSGTVTTKISGNFLYLTFHIIPAKTLDTSHIIIRAWDMNHSQEQANVLNAIKIVYTPQGFSRTSP